MVQSWAEGDWKNTVGKQCLSSFWWIRHPRFHMLLQSSVWLHKKCRRWIRLSFCTNWTHSSAVSRGLEIDALLSSLDQVLFPVPPPVPSSPYSQYTAEIGAKELAFPCPRASWWDHGTFPRFPGPVFFPAQNADPERLLGE